MKLRKPWQHRWIGRIGALFLRLLGATWRRRVDVPRDPEPAIYVFLHGDILLGAYVHRDRNHRILISTHRDGEAIAQIAQRLGFVAVRGSSTRGGATAVRSVLRDCKDHGVAVTPDGPRGPRGKVEPGLVQLASMAGWRIFPLGFAASHAVRLNSWDRFTIPYPFSRVICTLGDPVVPPADADRATCERLALEVSQRMLAAQEAAERELRSW